MKINPLNLFRYFSRLIRRNDYSGIIYMLHRCSPFDDGCLFPNENMKVSPEFLKKFILEKKKTHEFISLDELENRLKSGTNNKQKFIVMTFDDGYKDNLTYAYPVFKELNVPFTIYVTTSFPDRTAFLWWFILEDILISNTVITLSNGQIFSCETRKQKEECFMQIRELILKLDQSDLPNEFNKLLGQYAYHPESYIDKLCLTWDELKQLSDSNCCTIGAHTANHKTLNQLTKLELNEELRLGKQILEERLNRSINHFAFPFGTSNEVGDREITAAQQCGFTTSALAFGGTINRKKPINLHALPRTFLGELRQ